MYCYPRWFSFIPAFAVMATIFCFSHLPGNSFNLPDFPEIDKLLHSLVYCVLGVTAFIAVSRNTRRYKIARTGLLIVLFCLLYGISDEYHQSFVPGRISSIWDVFADALGGIVAVVFWYFLVEPYLIRRRSTH